MRLPRSLLAMLVAAAALPAAASLTTPQIIASALYPDCVDYRVVGVCYLLLCTPFGL